MFSFAKTSRFRVNDRLLGPDQANVRGRNKSETDEQAFKRWADVMSMGHFEEGWEINDRQRCHWPSAHRLWDSGDTQSSQLTVRSLHGLGDAVQMFRYAPQLLRLGKDVYYDVPAELRPLMPYFDGMSESGGLPAPHNAAVELSELPYLFRTQLYDLPLRTNYLVLPRQMVERRRASMGSGSIRRIGVVWAGGEWDRERWIPFRMLRGLFLNERFQWWNLQGYPAMVEAGDSPLRSSSAHYAEGLLGLAVTIGALDLVLTVDTLAAHIAGALGVPTWLMLKQQADWRWMIGQDYSPWYPSLRIFRQASPGDWPQVICEVEEALRKWE